MTNPEISVIMPALNAGQNIAPAIKSIIAQPFENFELIIIDNASTYDTPAIIGHLTTKNRRETISENPIIQTSIPVFKYCNTYFH